MSRLTQVAVLFAIVGVLLPNAAQAQRPGAQRPRPGFGPNIPKQNIKLSGTIKAMQAGLLQVENDSGGKWVVKLPDRGQGVTVVGSATREWLQRGARGLMVRFVATFDKSGSPRSPVSDVFVFTPRKWGGERDNEYKLGVYPEGASGELKGLFAGEGDKRPAAEVMDFRVVGQLAGVSKDAISVAAGGARVTAPLAEDLRVSVNIGDIRYVQLGDKVEVDGWHLPMQEGQVFANRVTVTAHTPLGSKADEKEAATGKPEPSEAGAK